MFKRSLLFACSLAALSGLGLTGQANADILDYNFGTAPGLTDSFPQFNPQLGTLDTITFFGSVPWSATVVWTNNSDTSGIWSLQMDAAFIGIVSNGDQFSATSLPVTDTGSVNPNSQSTVKEQPTVFDPSCFCFDIPAPLQLFFQEDSSSPLFQSYIGAGSLTFSGISGIEDLFAFWDPNLNAPNVTQDQNPYTLTAEYAFEPSATPEPSFALVIAAVFGLLVALRFGRAIRKPATE